MDEEQTSSYLSIRKQWETPTDGITGRFYCMRRRAGGWWVGSGRWWWGSWCRCCPSKGWGGLSGVKLVGAVSLSVSSTIPTSCSPLPTSESPFQESIWSHSPLQIAQSNSHSQSPGCSGSGWKRSRCLPKGIRFQRRIASSAYKKGHNISYRLPG